jgi:hypothetical protein
VQSADAVQRPVITLWNGEKGDGPGGTQHMVELVNKLTGRKPQIIDPASL